MFTHLKIGNNNETACGLFGSHNMAHDPRDTNCRRCKRTRIYKTMMAFERVSKKQHNAEVLRKLLDN